MKYGVVLCKTTENIGDDIQSYAAKCFLPAVDYVIDREGLDTFESRGEKVRVIMNGWYMYNKFNWPPVSSIEPLWTSIHISEKDYFGIGEKFLDGYGGAYLKHYAPVGARDISTFRMLNKHQIPCYMSGCLTLTLPPVGKLKPTDEVLLVDLDKDDEQKIRAVYPNENLIVISHNVNTAEHKELDVEERFRKVEILLNRYQNAKCVITSRLHCALPCLALKTPVLVVYKDEFASRMESFLELLHYCTSDELNDFLKKEFDIAYPPSNSENYLSIREKLIAQCRNFIQGTGIRAPYQQSLVEIHKWQKKLLNDAEYTFRAELLAQSSWIKQLTDDRAFFQMQSIQHQKRNKELQKWIAQLENGKGYLESQNKLQAERISELETWSKEVTEGKNYLEEQVREKDKRIRELEAWCQDVTEGKTYLESQWHQTESLLQKYRAKLDELENDPKIKRIMKKKKYSK